MPRKLTPKLRCNFHPNLENPTTKAGSSAVIAVELTGRRASRRGIAAEISPDVCGDPRRHLCSTGGTLGSVCKSKRGVVEPWCPWSSGYFGSPRAPPERSRNGLFRCHCTDRSQQETPSVFSYEFPTARPRRIDFGPSRDRLAMPNREVHPTSVARSPAVQDLSFPPAGAGRRDGLNRETSRAIRRKHPAAGTGPHYRDAARDRDRSTGQSVMLRFVVGRRDLRNGLGLAQFDPLNLSVPRDREIF